MLTSPEHSSTRFEERKETQPGVLRKRVRCESNRKSNRSTSAETHGTRWDARSPSRFQQKGFSQFNEHESAMIMLTKTLAALVASTVLAMSASAQSAKEIRSDTSFVPNENETVDDLSRHWDGPMNIPEVKHSATPVCENAEVNAQIREALHLVCVRPIADETPASASGLIVIGFLGGFVKTGDSEHPEVWFGSYLRERYSSARKVSVISNHEGKRAMRDLLQALDIDHDGVLTTAEKRQAKVILYGHSWGASEVVAFARDLGKIGIPVLLTVQIDIVRKPGQQPTLIPPNVEAAINFFQSEGLPHGLLHGRSKIVAEDPAETEIIGNSRMTFEGQRVDCRNYPWFARTFNKPHHEIENDARVWNQIAAVIDSLFSGNPVDRAALR